MNEINKNNFIKVACLMLLVIMMTTCVLSVTMAKYASNGSASIKSPNIAKWSITVCDEELEADMTLSKLSWEVFDEEGITTGLEQGDNMIAPGTWGYAAIEIINESDVSAIITITDLNTFGVESYNLEFKCVIMEGPPEKYDNEGDEERAPITKTLGPGDSITIYICFEWKYEADGDDKTANDKADTDLGKKAATNDSVEYYLECTFTITATQAIE